MGEYACGDCGARVAAPSPGAVCPLCDGRLSPIDGGRGSAHAH